MIERLRELYDAATSETASRRSQTPISELEQMHADIDEVPSFSEALIEKPEVSLIAEFKQASPSMGEINTDWNAGDASVAYAIGGAAAMSVLTIDHKFSGSLDFITEARDSLRHKGIKQIPILRKDFIDDEYQIHEAAAYGASAVLLITGGIDDDGRLKHLYDYADTLGLDSLVEVHDSEEMDRALELDPKIISINNRNLKGKDMKVSLGIFDLLANRVPYGKTLVAESGYAPTKEHKERVSWNGADAVLMGTELMKCEDPEQAIRDWNNAFKTFITTKA